MFNWSVHSPAQPSCQMESLRLPTGNSRTPSPGVSGSPTRDPSLSAQSGSPSSVLQTESVPSSPGRPAVITPAAYPPVRPAVNTTPGAGDLYSPGQRDRDWTTHFRLQSASPVRQRSRSRSPRDRGRSPRTPRTPRTPRGSRTPRTPRTTPRTRRAQMYHCSRNCDTSLHFATSGSRDRHDRFLCPLRPQVIIKLKL